MAANVKGKSNGEMMQGFRKGLVEALNKNKLVDFELRCGEYKFKVHKLILSIYSPVLEKACTVPFKEAQQNFMDLPDDNPTHIRAMVHAMYSFSYDATKDIKGESTSIFLFHVQMYLLADKYDIELIRVCALKNMANHVIRPDSSKKLIWNTAKVVVLIQVIKTAYEHFASRDNELRKFIARVCAEHCGELSKSPEFKKFVDSEEALEFGADLSRELLKVIDDKGLSCADCKTAYTLIMHGVPRSPTPKCPGGCEDDYIYQSNYDHFK